MLRGIENGRFLMQCLNLSLMRQNAAFLPSGESDIICVSTYLYL